MTAPNFCADCGTPLPTDSRYCANCGTKVPTPAHDAVGAPRESLAQTTVDAPHNLGAPITVWRKIRLTPRHKVKPAFDLDWLWSEVDVVLTGDAVVVVAASPVSKVYSSVENVSNVAIAAAPGAGFLLSLPLAVVAEAYEKLFGNHSKLEEAALGPLFESGRVLWISRVNARFRYFEVNGGFFGQCENVFVVSGAFRHKHGAVDTCVAASDQVLPRLSSFVKGFLKPEFPVEHTRLKKIVEVYRMLDAEYVFPNWSKILGHVL